MMKIAVMAGTPIDTSMGVALLSDYNISVEKSIAISPNPEQQTLFQVANHKKKIAIMRQHFKALKSEKIDIVFVYCNSLSSAIDFDSLAKQYKIHVITPLQCYQLVARKYDKIALLTANAQGAAGIERVMTQCNTSLNLISIAMIELVKLIEMKEAPQYILKKMSIKVLLDFFQEQQVQALIIGCTHFPYLLDDLHQITSLKLINPAIMMIEALKKIIDLKH